MRFLSTTSHLAHCSLHVGYRRHRVIESHPPGTSHRQRRLYVVFVDEMPDAFNHALRGLSSTASILPQNVKLLSLMFEVSPFGSGPYPADTPPQQPQGRTALVSHFPSAFHCSTSALSIMAAHVASGPSRPNCPSADLFIKYPSLQPQGLATLVVLFLAVCDHTFRWSAEPSRGNFHTVCYSTCHNCSILSGLPVFSTSTNCGSFFFARIYPAGLPFPPIHPSVLTTITAVTSLSAILWLRHSTLSLHVSRFNSCVSSDLWRPET